MLLWQRLIGRKRPMIADEIVGVVRAVIGDGSRELQRPKHAIHLSRINLGEGYVWEFEASLKRITGADFVIPVSSGTAALHLALIAAGVGKGDEVLCPSLTFAATANAIVYAGAVPHFVDNNVQTLGVARFKLRQYLGDRGFFHRHQDGTLQNIATGRRVAAIVAVHLLGNPCEIYDIHSIAEYYGIVVIEDAAEALGSFALTQHCGTIGMAGALSFNLNKIVTTDCGGAVLTNNQQISERVSHLARQAKVEHPFLWQHDEVGWNYRMSSMGAALGVEQLGRLAQTLSAKLTLAARYAVSFDDNKNVSMIDVPGSNHWLNAILLDPRVMNERDAVIQALLDDGFEARAIFTPLHKLSHFKFAPRQGSLQTAEDIWRRCICLPSTP
jgi:perosamine synthetase